MPHLIGLTDWYGLRDPVSKWKKNFLVREEVQFSFITSQCPGSAVHTRRRLPGEVTSKLTWCNHFLAKVIHRASNASAKML